MDEITLKLNSQQNYKNNIESNKLDSNNKLKELKDVSNQFESIFINQILKQARQNKIENGLFDSEAINTFNSMIDEQYSEILSKKTNFGNNEASRGVLGLTWVDLGGQRGSKRRPFGAQVGAKLGPGGGQISGVKLSEVKVR